MNIQGKPITIETLVHCPVKKVWECFTKCEHIIKWNFAAEEWHSPKAESDLTPGGKFNYRMEAKDGTDGFDFSGTFDEIVENDLIKYTLDDGRKVSIYFHGMGDSTKIIESFEPENENEEEFQKRGWQAILDNFKIYCEKI